MDAIYTQSSGTIRVYSANHDDSVRDGFTSVVSVFWIDPQTALLFGALTTGTKQTLRDLLPVFQLLMNMGAKFIQMKRTKGRKMPFGQIIKPGMPEDLWEIDLHKIMNLLKNNADAKEVL